MDRSWMNESRISPEYEEGVEQFLQFASERGQPDEDGKYYCPCINCLNGRRQILDDIRKHLLCDGIKRNYTTHAEWVAIRTGAVGPAKPADRPDDEVDDPLYLMTLTIPQLFLKPLQVMWDATLFGLFNKNFPLYIKHEDLSEIAHGGQCLSISVIQLWILHMTETSMRAGNINVYGFLEPQSIQRSGQS
ncbi:hypothetical protein GmHk_01G001999 [Glycine max]|nr:hypothetical protein GmHk_01G001999 [Glycine max]